MGWSPGPGKGGQKKQKHPHLQQTPKQKPFFFRFQAEDLLNPSMVWIAL